MSSRVVSVVSARPDGATSLAVGLASLLASNSRTLLIDLNLDRPEVAALLDLDERRTIYHLAYGAQLAAVSRADLEANLVWHEGLAILVGPARAEQRDALSEHFVQGLLEQAASTFDHVIVDIGRARPGLPQAATSGDVLWVVVPRGLGMAALERSWRELSDANVSWPSTAGVVLNRVDHHAFSGADHFIKREYGLQVAATMPQAPEFWRGVELGHSLRALSVPLEDERNYVNRYGSEALETRRALEHLTGALSVGEAAAEAAHGAASG